MNDGLKDSQREAILGVLENCPKLERAILFGSRAMGTHTATSDVDIALEGDLSLSDQAKLAEQIEHLTIPYTVDLVRAQTITSEELKAHIKQYGKVWYAREEEGTTDAHGYTRMVGTFLSEYVDFNPSRPLKRGSIASFVDMASLPVGERDISDIQLKEFTGGGSRFTNGDTLLARITPCLENGKTAKVSGLKDGENAFGSTEFIVLSAKDTATDEDYTYYLARHPEFRSFAISRMEGTSGRQRVSWQAVSEFEFDFPESHIRAQAGRILKTLDDKIALNRKVNETLEGMARALFQSWFVDFDPVKAKLAAVRHGRDPEKACMAALAGKLRIPPGKPKPELLATPAQAPAQAEDSEADPSALGLPTADELDTAIASLETLSNTQLQTLTQTASHFPSDFQESELGLIPEGWEVGTISVHANVIMGQSPKGETYNVEGIGMPLVNGPVEFGDFFTVKSKWTTSPTKQSKPGDLIVCVRGSTTGRYVKSDGEYCLGRGVCALRGLESQAFADYLYKFSCQELLGMTTGSTFPNWSGPVIKNFEVIKPPSTIIALFDAQVQPSIDSAASNEHQSRTLAELRDTLLPKLLSGELPIPEAQTTVEAAVEYKKH